MQSNFTGEIASYLKHADISLAVRRMLDLSLDLGDKEFMKETILWSKNYHEVIKDNAASALPQQFFDTANDLLVKSAAIKRKPVSQSIKLIEAAHIAKTYSKGNFSLKPISLQVSNGDIIGIVGENGNGKTTLLRCLAGQLAIDAGEVHYHLLDKPDYYAVKNYVVFIPQRIPRWYGLLKDNLHFSASITGIKGEENELMVEFMLERLGLSNYASLTWNQISSGYRTRFEIARVLLQKPQLLILDEPLANLDINAQQTILTDLKFLAKSAYNPMGVLLSSQQLHEVEKVADTVLFIKQGNCIFKTGQQVSETIENVIEIESTATREELLAIFNGSNVHIQYNGGFYTITTADISVENMLSKIVNERIPVTYFRDITHSTKRYFN